MTVAVTYFRAGYTPNDYPTQDEWQARELIERSNTVQVCTLPLLITLSPSKEARLTVHHACSVLRSPTTWWVPRRFSRC
jgi:hypothetical protein